MYSTFRVRIVIFEHTWLKLAHSSAPESCCRQRKRNAWYVTHDSRAARPTSAPGAAQSRFIGLLCRPIAENWIFTWNDLSLSHWLNTRQMPRNPLVSPSEFQCFAQKIRVFWQFGQNSVRRVCYVISAFHICKIFPNPTTEWKVMLVTKYPGVGSRRSRGPVRSGSWMG